MGLEAASWITDLVSTNPVGATDKKSQGDDHIRLIKAVLQACFPAASKAFYFPKATGKTANFSVLASEANKTFIVTTTGGVVTATLPALAAGDDGWECHFIKENAGGANPLFIAPASGTLKSGEREGLAKCRRMIPGHRCSALWNGSIWAVSRVPSVPVGTILEFCGADCPVGYEFAYGQTLASASTDYPEFYGVNGGSGVVPDDRGRVAAGKDNMGGSAASRLVSIIEGVTLGYAGGTEMHTLTSAQMPIHSHGGTTGGGSPHDHDINPDAATFSSQNAPAPGGATPYPHGTRARTEMESAHTHTIPADGSGNSHSNTQPTIVRNKIVVLE